MTKISVSELLVCDTGLSVTLAELTLPVSGPLDLERLEGMAVVVPQTLTVTENYNLGRFGELMLSANGRLFNPTQIAQPGAEAQMVAADNALRWILLDDGSTRQNPPLLPYPVLALDAFNTVRSGDSVWHIMVKMKTINCHSSKLKTFPS